MATIGMESTWPNRRPLAISLYSVFKWLSLFSCVIAALLGQPVLAGAIILPWASFAFVRNPSVLLAAYLYVPLYKSAVVSYLLVDLTLWLALLCIITVLLLVMKDGRVPIDASTVAWLVFSIILTVTTMTSGFLDVAVKTMIPTFGLTVIPLLLAIMVGRRSDLLEKFLSLTLWASVGYSVLVLVFMLLGDTGRIALVSNTIGAGRLAIMGALLAPVVLKQSRWKSVNVLFLISLTLLASLASGSRGPLVAAFAAVVMIYVLPSRWAALRLLMVSVAGIVAILVLKSSWIESIVPTPSLFRIRLLIDAALGADELDNSSALRFELMGHGLRMWTERPVLGWGPGTFAAHSTTFSSPGFTTYPHNALVQAAGELGTIGLLWFIVVIAASLCGVYRQLADPVAKGVGILLIFALVSAQFSNDLYDNRWMWGMLLLGIAMGMRTTELRRPLSRESDRSSVSRLERADLDPLRP